MKRFVLALVLSAWAIGAGAAPILLDSMLITVDNQESTIGSDFQGPQIFHGNLTIPTGATVDYFSVEITDIQVTPSTPRETTLEYFDFSRPNGSEFLAKMLFWDGSSQIQVGDTLIADGTTRYLSGTNTVVSSAGMYDIFAQFVNGPGIQPPVVGYNRAGWLGAVDSPYIGLEFTVSAYGEPVPIPAAAYLFGSALGILGWMRRRES